MSQASRRAQFYRSLATMEDAGLPRLRALRQRFSPPFSGAARRLTDAMEAEGLTLSEAMTGLPRTFSTFERNLIAIGEATGRLDSVFAALADWYALQHRSRSRLIGRLLYPAVVYHVAALLVPLIGVFTGQGTVAQAVLRALVLLALPWGALLLARIMCGLWASAFDALLLVIPIVGSLSHRMNYSRFFEALGMALHAGIPFPAAVTLSADTCTNTHIGGKLRSVADIMQHDGIAFTEALAPMMSGRERRSVIPEIMQTGELSGTADDSATRVAAIYRDELEQQLNRLTTIIPILLYLVLAVYIGVQVVSAYSRLLQPVRDLLE